MNRIRKFFQSPWLRDYRVLFALWLIIGLASALTKLSPMRHNNYDIFRYVFYNTVNGVSLYQPAIDGGFLDLNHYGPVFSLVIAPFAMCPTWLGLTLWCTALAALLFWAVRKSTLNRYQQIFVFWFCAHELLTALFMQQFNVAIAAIILLSFGLIEKEKDFWAAFFIVIGTMVKLYGIVGLAFFFFSRHKGKFVLSLLAWSAILFVLPMLISSPSYQIGQYQEWISCLVEKNEENAGSLAQNISMFGMAHRISGKEFSDLWILVPCMAMFATAYFRIRQWENRDFRLMVLASVLMIVCLFSTGTESSGYIIALTGVVIWYTASPWKRNGWDLGLLIFAFILTSLSPSDLFPKSLAQNWVKPYSLKALPVAIIWLKLCVEMLHRDYREVEA